MTDHDYGEDRDPLLVRPFLLHDSGSPAAEPSTQTWPSATTREVRSHRALEGADDPTAILYLPPPRRRPAHRRLVVVAVASVAVLLGAAAGVAALRPDGHRPATTTALQDPPPLATTDPVPGPPSPVASSTAPSGSAGASRRSTPTGSASAGAPATSGTAAAGNGTSVVSPAAQGRTTAPPAAFAPELPAGRTGPIRGQNGLCLDLTGGVAVEDTQVLVLGCTGTATQTWTLATDGTMQVSGMCALIVGDDTVHIAKCDGRTTAQWRVSGQRLINASNLRCLTDPSGGRDPGTAVQVTICGGAANQRWSLP